MYKLFGASPCAETQDTHTHTQTRTHTGAPAPAPAPTPPPARAPTRAPSRAPTRVRAQLRARAQPPPPAPATTTTAAPLPATRHSRMVVLAGVPMPHLKHGTALNGGAAARVGASGAGGTAKVGRAVAVASSGGYPQAAGVRPLHPQQYGAGPGGDGLVKVRMGSGVKRELMPNGAAGGVGGMRQVVPRGADATDAASARSHGMGVGVSSGGYGAAAMQGMRPYSAAGAAGGMRPATARSSYISQAEGGQLEAQARPFTAPARGFAGVNHGGGGMGPAGRAFGGGHAGAAP
eukprot:scaffold87520_cov16-Tisochrysis_lutea.AAC.1